MRLNKYLQQAGVGSRREAERLVLAGMVTVDGVVADVTTVVGDGAVVSVEGRVVAPEQAALPRVFAYHKPTGVIVTARDHEGRKTLYEALAELPEYGKLPRLMPVGRLDLNSEGLLLLTTDGMLAQALMSPKTALKRVYRVRVFGELTLAELAEFKRGVTVEGVWYRGAEVVLEKTGESGSNRWYRVVLTEGKNREIRRIFKHFNCEVNRLVREEYGPFALGDLVRGQLREMDAAAVKKLMRGIKV